MADDKTTPQTNTPTPTQKKLSLPLILVLANSAIALGALGLFIYVKMIYQRPQITENAERARIIALSKKQKPTQPGFLSLKPMTINVGSVPHQKQRGKTFPGKLHYLTFQLVLEFRNIKKQNFFEAIKPIFLDKLLSLLGHKQFHELNTAQGRYLLRTQIIELVNMLLKKNLVTNTYFSEFILQ